MRPSEDSQLPYHPEDRHGSPSASPNRSFPNPFEAGVGGGTGTFGERTGRARTLPPAISIARTRDVEAERGPGPAVPPSPSQWLSRSPVSSAYFPASVGSVTPPALITPDEAMQLGEGEWEAHGDGEDEDDGEGAWEEDELFAQMMGLRKQIEADANAAASASASLEQSRGGAPKSTADNTAQAT